MLAPANNAPSVPRWTWLIPLTAGLLFVVLVFVAPAEKTLGQTIRYVYVHVAFTRAGMWGFYLAGVLGFVAAVGDRLPMERWASTAVWVAYSFFLAGGVASIFAQQRSWGGMLLTEPRNRTTLAVLAVGAIVLVLASWLPWVRLRGLLYAALGLYVAWIIPQTPLILHPANAAGSSTSVAIRLAFPLLTGLALLMGAWLVWYVGTSRYSLAPSGSSIGSQGARRP